MWQRIYLIIKLFISTVAICTLQRPLFMLYHLGEHPEVSISDFFDVMLHSLPLDMTVAGYLTALPLIIIILGKWHKPILKVYYVIISALMSLIFIADTVLYEFWGFKIDSTVFAYTDKPADAMASVSVWLIVAAVVAIAAIAAVYSLLFFKIVNKKLKAAKSAKASYYVKAAGLYIITAGLLFLAIRGGVGEGTANVSRAYYSDNQFLNHSAINPAFNIIYSMAHQQNFANEFRFMSEEEREKYNPFANKAKADSADCDSLDSSSPKIENCGGILLIVWEGLGARCIKSLGGYDDVTPFLDKIISEGMLFTQCYATSFRTDRGLISIMSGWPGMPSASIMKIPNKCSNLPGIAHSLAQHGYATDFWYGGDITFTNMGGFMLANGFQKTYSDADFSVKDRLYSKWGVVDGILLDRLADDILQRPVDTSHPWFTSVLTLSSHEPWEVPYNRLKDKKQNAFAYTDECIGKLISRLKQSPIWDNLLVVITADHGAMVDNSDACSSTMVSRIPFVITGGKIKQPKRVDTIMSQADIAATLLGLLGIDHSDFTFSRDVLNDPLPYPNALHTSPIDATFTDSTGTTTYDFVGKQTTFTTDSNTDSTRILRIKAALQTIYNAAAEL